MTIGQVAKASGVAAKTIRFYEAAGVLAAPRRTAAGYRQYAGEDVERLLFVRRARALGLSLRDVKALLSALDGRAHRPAGPRVRELVRHGRVRRHGRTLGAVSARCGTADRDRMVVRRRRESRRGIGRAAGRRSRVLSSCEQQRGLGVSPGGIRHFACFLLNWTRPRISCQTSRPIGPELYCATAMVRSGLITKPVECRHPRRSS